MRQSGMALVEALVASSLLGLGLLGASRLTLRALDAAFRTAREHHVGFGGRHRANSRTAGHRAMASFWRILG